MKSIKNIIKETVLKETNSTIKIDDSHFFSILVESKNKRKFCNFCGLVTAIIISIVAIITSLVFFINDVLLFPNNPTINKEGAIIFERSCNRQSVLFLFNPAERWANTGIQLQEGDKIKISYSGGFHSDVSGLEQAAKDNDKPKYEWINFTTKNKTNEELRKKMLYKDGDFGSVLYVMASEFGVQDDDSVFFQQIERGKSIEIAQNGTLYLSVNDIYLTDSITKQYGKMNKIKLMDYEKTNHTKFRSYDSISSDDFKNIGGRDSIDLYWDNGNTVHVSGDKFQMYFKNNPNAFFNDNLGTILVLIDINRKIEVGFWSWRTSCYRYAENTINGFLDN